MPDKIFSDPLLVQIYDSFDGHREDLIHYIDIVQEFGAHTVLDIGCGTGCFACLLAEKGYAVTGLDPAQSSLDIAKQKPFAEKVNWICGDAKNLPNISADMAIMTGNVAQVFLTDEAWQETIQHIRTSLKQGGLFVFEVRDPSQKAWENWTKENTYQRLHVKGVGYVEGWCRVDKVTKEHVSFTWNYHFEDAGKTIESHSVLRFRGKDEIQKSLESSGYKVLDIRDAPDRPKLEFVFIAQLL